MSFRSKGWLRHPHLKIAIALPPVLPEPVDVWLAGLAICQRDLRILSAHAFPIRPRSPPYNNRSVQNVARAPNAFSLDDWM
jgi:hypothetical protein